MEHLLNPPAVIGEAVAGTQAQRANAVRKALSVLSEDIKSATFDTAILLYEARVNNYAPGWGYTTVIEYGEKELGLKERKVQYLIRMVRVCNAVGISRKVYEPVGVSKLREITTLDFNANYHNPKTHAVEPMADHIRLLIDIAPGISYEKVKEKVAVLKGEVGENARVWVPSFWVTQSCMDNVILPARELVRRRLGSSPIRDEVGNAVEYSDAVAEEIIHAEFIADPSNYTEETDESKEQIDDDLDAMDVAGNSQSASGNSVSAELPGPQETNEEVAPAPEPDGL